MKNFKKLVLLFLVASVALVSCNKDDDSGSGSIEGKWQFSKEGFIENGIEELENYEHSPNCNKDNIEFVAGGVYKGTIYDVDGTTNCEIYSITGTWSKNGNSLSNTVSGQTSTAEILELSSTTLKIKFVDDFDDSIYITVFTRI